MSRPAVRAFELMQLASGNASRWEQQFGKTFGLTGVPALARIVLEIYEMTDPMRLPPLLRFILERMPLSSDLVSKGETTFFALERDWWHGVGDSRENSLQIWKVVDGVTRKVDRIRLVNGLIATRLHQLFRRFTYRGTPYEPALDVTSDQPNDPSAELVWSVVTIHVLVSIQNGMKRRDLGLSQVEIEQLHLAIPTESPYRLAISQLEEATIKSPGHITDLARVVAHISRSLRAASSMLAPPLMPSTKEDGEIFGWGTLESRRVRDWKAAKAKRGGGGRSAGRDFRGPEEDDNPFSLDNTKGSSSDSDSDEDNEESGDESDGFGGTISKKSTPKSREDEAREEEELAKSLGAANIATPASTTTKEAPAAGGPSSSASTGGRGLGERKVVKSPEEIARLREAKKVEKKPASTDSPKNLNKGAPVQMSRREREEKEKAAARERYMALHAAGKTDEAKKDMARLAAIRKQREAQKAAKEKEAADKEAARTAALAKSGRKIAK
ncbi:hypothetical protein JCM3766R1_005320 [Sporobolomyces carnicolor]